MPFQTLPDPDFPSKAKPTTTVSYAKAAQSGASSSSQPRASSSTQPRASPSSQPRPPLPTTLPVYFWRPEDPNGYLGQWHRSHFTVSGSTYVTAEMYMMVQKARLFGDTATAAKMLDTTDPKRQKALGRQVKNFDAQVWDERKLGIVEQGNWYNFMASHDAERLKGWLLATGERELVEASPYNRVWGIGFAERNAAASRAAWGENLLGVALMRVRKRLREEGGM
jgi:ribA/ribD-fused uncharacterized protein